MSMFSSAWSVKDSSRAGIGSAGQSFLLAESNAVSHEQRKVFFNWMAILIKSCQKATVEDSTTHSLLALVADKIPRVWNHIFQFRQMLSCLAHATSLHCVIVCFEEIQNNKNWHLWCKGSTPVACHFLDIELEGQIGERGLSSLQFFNSPGVHEFTITCKVLARFECCLFYLTQNKALYCPE